jgi:hypothetical protein
MAGVIGASGSNTVRTRTMAERSRMQQDKVRHQQEARRAEPADSQTREVAVAGKVAITGKSQGDLRGDLRGDLLA